MEIQIENNDATIIEHTENLHYYKNILYRKPTTNQFPIIYYMLKYKKSNYNQYMIVKVIGFKNSLLQDNYAKQTHFECKFHDILEYAAIEEHVYDKKCTYYVWKGEINLNLEIQEINSLNVLKIIISLENYIIKPDIDCMLTKKEELYYRHLYYNELNPFENLNNPYDNTKWTELEDLKYWEKAEKEKNLNSIHNNQTKPQNKIEFWINNKNHVIFIKKGKFNFYERDVYRNPVTNQFPTFRYKCKYFQRYNHKIIIYGYEKCILQDGKEIFKEYKQYEQFFYHPKKIKENNQYCKGKGEILLNEILNSNVITIRLCIQQVILEPLALKKIYFHNKRCPICKDYVNRGFKSDKKVINLQCINLIHKEHTCHEICVLNEFHELNICFYCIKETICIICLEYVIIDSNKITLSCNHDFHKDCINKWLNGNNTCPHCRKEVE